MPLFDTPDGDDDPTGNGIGHYTHAITTANEGDGNDVVYDNWIVPGKKTPVWDKLSYEARIREAKQPIIPVVSPPILNPPISGNILEIKRGANPIGMSYWRNINQHKGQNILYVLLSINDELTIFTIDKLSFSVLNERQLGIHHTGEGCYFSAIDVDILYVPTAKELFKINVNTLNRSSVWLADIGINLWQMHSSYDEKVYSASIQDESYNIIKWGVHIDGKVKYFSLNNEPDECQIDASGTYLLVKEKLKINNEKFDEYNRIINIRTGREQIVHNEEGAVGHSDCGFGCVIGENDMSNLAGALDYIRLGDLVHQNMFSTEIWNMGYVSFTNAKPDTEVYNQKCLMSTPLDLIALRLDGTGKGVKVCGNLTQSSKYEHRVKANLCPEGEFAVWTAFVDGSLNAYLVRVPLI